MKRVGVVGIALWLTALMIGCGTQTVTTEADSPDAQVEADNDGGAPESAELGDSITLDGNEDGLEMSVTPLKVVDPAKSDDGFSEPKAGNRYVAIQVRLENVGTIAFSDSPSNGAVVIDAKDQSYSASIFDEVKPAFGSVKIAPGDGRVGFLTFELSKRAKLRSFQFTLDSGFGPESGQWSLQT
jgi:hypothetical protein